MIFLKFIFALLIAQTVEAAEVPAGFKISDECQSFIEKIKDKYEYDWVQTRTNLDVAAATEKKDLNQDVYVFYYYRKGNLVNGQMKNPIVFFNGGPGFSSHGQSDLVEVARVKHQIQTELDFIFIDQRGTGCSSPFPLGIDRSVLEKLKWFGSKGIVYDAELVRQKLIGAKPWKIFGQSFGAQVVYRYLSLFPQSIAKAYAHGNAVNITDEERTYNRIVSQYNVTEAYLKVYPDDRRRLFSFKLKLSDKNFCLKNSIRDYCGYEMLTPLVYNLGFKNYWANLHSWLVTIVPQFSVSDEGLQSYVNQFITSASFYYRESAAPDQKTNISLNFLGFFDWNTKPLTLANCQKVYDKMHLKLKLDVETLLLDECKAPLQFEFVDKVEPVILAEWPDLQGDFVKAEDILLQIKKFKISVFTYSGSLDCFVPKESFVAQNKVFGSNVKYTNFLNSGHDGFLEERQVYVDLTK